VSRVGGCGCGVAEMVGTSMFMVLLIYIRWGGRWANRSTLPEAVAVVAAEEEWCEQWWKVGRWSWERWRGREGSEDGVHAIGAHAAGTKDVCQCCTALAVDRQHTIDQRAHIYNFREIIKRVLYGRCALVLVRFERNSILLCVLITTTAQPPMDPS